VGAHGTGDLGILIAFPYWEAWVTESLAFHKYITMGLEELTVFYFLVSIFWIYFTYFLARALQRSFKDRNRSAFRFSREDWLNSIAIFSSCIVLCSLLIMVAQKHVFPGLHSASYLLAIPLALASAWIYKTLN